MTDIGRKQDRYRKETWWVQKKKTGLIQEKKHIWYRKKKNMTDTGKKRSKKKNEIIIEINEDIWKINEN